MGQAKLRGTRDERVNAAVIKADNDRIARAARERQRKVDAYNAAQAQHERDIAEMTAIRNGFIAEGMTDAEADSAMRDRARYMRRRPAMPNMALSVVLASAMAGLPSMMRPSTTPEFEGIEIDDCMRK